MKKGKILQPILFALALVMVFSVLGVTPAYAGVTPKTATASTSGAIIEMIISK